VDGVFAEGASPTGPEIWLATHAFMIQIYCDFSGYTDMARGVARLFGFELMENFRLPLLATHPSDYWRRWHISLSSWLRDYLYIPLGGNRRGASRTSVNLFLTMLLGGLWHGAAWNFVLWGAYQGVLLVGARRLQLKPTRRPGQAAGRQRLRHFGAWLITFELMAFGWMLFRAESLSQIAGFVTTLLAVPDWGMSTRWLPTFLLLCTPLFLIQLVQARSGKMEVLEGRSLIARALVYASMTLVLAVLGEDGGEPFIYFQF
jgi:D-alanyl-lipoteichoic acid acyltransferase DltB (MBOAT superfamily)